MPRRRFSETVVYWLLPVVMLYMVGYGVWSIVRPLFGL